MNKSGQATRNAPDSIYFTPPLDNHAPKPSNLQAKPLSPNIQGPTNRSCGRPAQPYKSSQSLSPHFNTKNIVRRSVSKDHAVAPQLPNPNPPSIVARGTTATPTHSISGTAMAHTTEPNKQKSWATSTIKPSQSLSTPITTHRTTLITSLASTARATRAVQSNL